MKTSAPLYGSLSSRLSRLLLALLGVCAAAAPVRGQTEYDDYTLANHIARYIALSTQGYRMISLDVTGDRTDQRYAAVWVRQTGPEFDALHGASRQSLDRWTATQRALGYREHLITASGSGTNTVYACVMVRDTRAWAYAPAMTRVEFDLLHLYSRTSDYRLVSAAIHGTAAAPLYAAVWAANDEQILWGLSAGDTAAQHQAKFDVFVQECWARPAFVTHSEHGRYLSMFADDSLGNWSARHDLTKAAYDLAEAAMRRQHMIPIQISVSGLGSAARYAAIFAENVPVFRQVTVSGQQVPAFDHVDRFMVGRGVFEHGFMQHNQARAASIAIAKDGKLVFARGYTFAEPGYPITAPTTAFRIASCSKPLTAIAFYQQMRRNPAVYPERKLVEFVSFPTIHDPRVNDIELGHLLDHRSGYENYWGDGCLDKLAAARNSIANVDLGFDPGSQENYSNEGYMMLGLVIEALSGRSYQHYMQGELFRPLDVVRPFLLSTSYDAREARPHETMQFTTGGAFGKLEVAPSAVLSNNPLVNYAYGVSPFALDATGGWTMSTVDYVRLLAGVFDRGIVQSVIDEPTRHALEQRIEMGGRTGGWDSAATRNLNGRTYRSYRKGGLWHSGHAQAIRRTDGISIAVFCSGPTVLQLNDIDDFVDRVTTWPTHDLFPTYLMPEFQRHYGGRFTAFGAACPGTNLVPRVGVSGTPETGNDLTFRLTSGPLSRPAFLLAGLSDRFYGRMLLPFDLGLIGAAGCSLYVSPDFPIGTLTDASGAAAVRVALPGDPLLVGGTFFAQFAGIDPGANALGASWSDAVETVIGGIR